MANILDTVKKKLGAGPRKGIKKSKKRKPKGSVFRDFRGTQGVINDASGDVRRRRNQTTDSNN